MSGRLNTLSLVLLTIGGLFLATDAARAADVVFARHLALSPDGQVLAFSWAGDIWTVSTTGGAATRLTANDAYDANPVFSRDGRTIAFASNRDGAASIYLMNPDGTNVRRLTYTDRSCTPTDFTPDDQSVIFDSSEDGQVEREEYVYRVPVTGGQHWKLVDGMGAEGRVAANGDVVFARGSSPWWRRRYRGSANDDLWLYTAATGKYRQLTDHRGNDRAACWVDADRGCYFLSDRGGDDAPMNVWFQPLDGPARQLTHFTTDDVRDLAVSRDGKRLACTHWDKLYVIDLPDGQPHEIKITAGGDRYSAPRDYKSYTNSADEVEISPDGNEAALVVRGEIFVIKTEPDRLTRRVTDSPARDRQVVWSPDGKSLFFISDRDGHEQIYRATSAEEPAGSLSDALRFKIERVTAADQPDWGPSVSPDGKSLLFRRGLGQLVVRDLATGAERVLVDNWNESTYRWSPDSQWIAYAIEDAEYNSDIWIAKADGSAPAVNISQHPDNDDNPQWSADGQILAFTSRREGFDSDLYMVFLSRELDEASSVRKAEYFDKAGKAAKKRKPLDDCVASGVIALAGAQPTVTTQPAAESQPADPAVEAVRKELAALQDKLKDLQKQLDGAASKPAEADRDSKTAKLEKPDASEPQYAYDLDSAYRRLRRVTRLADDQYSFALHPAGETLIFASGHEGRTNLYSVKWDGDDLKRIISGSAGALQFTLTGDRLVYLRGGVPHSCSASGSDDKTHSFRAKLIVDHVAEARQKFDDAARMLGLKFYHPTLKHLDWPALTDKYRSLALQVATTEEFNEIFNMLQGELNGSHLGIYGPGGRGGVAVGYLGVQLDRTYAGPGLKVAGVTPESPASRSESRLYPGDIILAVDGQPVGPDFSIQQALLDTVGDPVILEVAPAADRPDNATTTGDRDTGGDLPGRDPNDLVTDARDNAASDDPPATTSAPAGETPGSTTQRPDGKLEIVIRPISYGAYNNLRYLEWVSNNRRYVDEHSGGRLGYAHIRGMDAGSFNVFERDLYAAAHGKDGLIIDVRNNGGGWTADWVMAVLSVKRHAFTIGRGGQRGYPQDRLIFYAWTKPTTMMCNQYSYSNAEIVSHAFKNLGRGPLVGEETHGAVISTGAYGLIDGSRIRMPFRGWYTLPDERDMELHGAMPDIRVPVGPADEAAGSRPQLDAAIKATLEQVTATERAASSAP